MLYNMRYLKKILLSGTIFFLMLCFFSNDICISAVNAAIKPPVISAEASCLIVADTGRILFEKDKDKIMYPASTTKIVTLLVALQKGKMDDIVTVSGKAANVEGSSLDLEAGDQLSLRELLWGMMLVSGNDASVAVAEHIGKGSVWRFVKMMNDIASSAGAKKTHFSNPNGLPDPNNHFTTAYDMALITAQAYKKKEFIDIVSSRSHTVIFTNKGAKWVKNTNKLLAAYQGANGVKTGYTEAAGDCLVAAAKRNGVQLIAVIFNDDERWADAAALLDYGFKIINIK